tara:strand:- start:312 stop:488 length:177 start_codon:yes stop_codon:yes gene_type:complete
MDKLILEIRDILKKYPDYDEILTDEKNNIIIKKNIISKNKDRDTITEIVKKFIKEDMK